MPSSGGGDERSSSGNGLLAGHRCAGVATGKGAKVMVTVVQCIRSGIDNDAISTMTQHVICTCGFRTRRRFKPTHTALPSNKERSADSARIASIIFSLPSPLPSQLGQQAYATAVGRAWLYPPCQPKPLRPNRCRTNRRCAGPLSPQPVRVAPPHGRHRFARPPCVSCSPCLPAFAARSERSIPSEDEKAVHARPRPLPDRWPKPVALPLVRGHPVRAGSHPFLLPCEFLLSCNATER